MPYNFVPNSFHTKKLCSRLSSSELRFFTEIGRFAFFRPPLGDLGATYDDHLRLIGKRVVDFLLALIDFFSLGVTAEALRLRAIIGSKSVILLQRGPVDPKFQVEGVAFRDVKVLRPTWSRDHFFGLGLGLTVIGLGLGLMR